VSAEGLGTGIIRYSGNQGLIRLPTFHQSEEWRCRFGLFPPPSCVERLAASIRQARVGAAVGANQSARCCLDMFFAAAGWCVATHPPPARATAWPRRVRAPRHGLRRPSSHHG
jgi:hypothetical protein